jgi:hypothetical protein
MLRGYGLRLIRAEGRKSDSVPFRCSKFIEICDQAGARVVTRVTIC